jgi:hypothetical protein
VTVADFEKRYPLSHFYMRQAGLTKEEIRLHVERLNRKRNKGRKGKRK